MNERIEKLLAELDIDLYTDEGVRVTSILVRPKDLRQFAELIVKECADICYNRDYACGSAYGEQIEKHFGVEE